MGSQLAGLHERLPVWQGFWGQWNDAILRAISMGGGNVFLGRRGACPKEKLLHVMNDDLLVLLARRVQAVFVEQHLAVLHPLTPGLLRHVVIDSFAKVVIERRLWKARQLLFQF